VVPAGTIVVPAGMTSTSGLVSGAQLDDWAGTTSPAALMFWLMWKKLSGS
jgi:hypothetical protein